MDWYRMLMESPSGGLDITGQMWQFIHYLLVELPFGLLRILVSSIAFILNFLDLSHLFEPLRLPFFDHSRTMFLRLIGGREGHIAVTSVAFILLSVSLIYLVWQFYFGKGNFAKKVVHVISVVVLGFAYFGMWNVDGTTMRGGMAMINTVSQVAGEFRENVMIDLVGTSRPSSLSSHDGFSSFADYYRSYILRTTFHFINSGSMDGTYAPGRILDRDRLMPPPDLSADEQRSFLRDRQRYIDEMATYNPYVQANGGVLILRMMAVGLGFVNGFILAIPVVFINLTITGFGLLLLVMILLFPFALGLSFLPGFQNAVFKFLKVMMGILFVPTLLGFLLAIFFYLNQMIDTLILEAADRILGMGAGADFSLASLTGYMALVVYLVLVVVKWFLLRAAWKNKGKILCLVSGDKLSDTYLNQPTDYMKEKADQVATYAQDQVTGGAKVALGAYTGNPGMMLDGIVEMKGNQAPEMDTADERDLFEDEPVDPSPASHDTMSDLMSKAAIVDDDLETDEPSFEDDTLDVPSEDEDIQDVFVVNHDDLADDSAPFVKMDESQEADEFDELEVGELNLDDQLVDGSDDQMMDSTVDEPEINEQQLNDKSVDGSDDQMLDSIVDEPEINEQQLNDEWVDGSDDQVMDSTVDEPEVGEQNLNDALVDGSNDPIIDSAADESLEAATSRQDEHAFEDSIVNEPEMSEMKLNDRQTDGSDVPLEEVVQSHEPHELNDVVDSGSLGAGKEAPVQQLNHQAAEIPRDAMNENSLNPSYTEMAHEVHGTFGFSSPQGGASSMPEDVISEQDWRRETSPMPTTPQIKSFADELESLRETWLLDQND